MNASQAQQQEFTRRLGVARRYRARMDEALVGLGLSAARWRILYALSQSSEPLSQIKLAELCGTEAPTLVRSLDTLERQGLIVRQPDQTDRRVKRVSLTDTAGPLVAEMIEIGHQVRRQVMAGISSADLAVAIRVLDAMDANIAASRSGEQAA